LGVGFVVEMNFYAKIRDADNIALMERGFSGGLAIKNGSVGGLEILNMPDTFVVGENDGVLS
jgi:hypothetical protein